MLGVWLWPPKVSNVSYCNTFLETNITPSVLDMGSNSGQLEFNISDFPNIDNAKLMAGGKDDDYWNDEYQEIGIFSGGKCHVAVSELQNFATKKDLLKIDFKIKHKDLQWPLSDCSMNVNWGNKLLFIDASRVDDYQILIQIDEIVKGVTKYEKIDYEITCIGDDNQQIGKKIIGCTYVSGSKLLDFDNYKLDKWGNNVRSIYGLKIKTQMGSSPPEYEAILLKPKKRLTSSNKIQPQIWVGKNEVNFPHEEQMIQPSKNITIMPQFDWKIKNRIDSHMIRELWSDNCEPIEYDLDVNQIITNPYGSSYEVIIPLKLVNINYDSLVVVFGECKIQINSNPDISKSWINSTPNNKSIEARFIVTTKPKNDFKFEFEISTYDISSKSIKCKTALRKMIKKMKDPYVQKGVHYFAEGEISDQDNINLVRYRFSNQGGSATLSPKLNKKTGEWEEVKSAGIFCPNCGNLLEMNKCKKCYFESGGSQHVLHTYRESIIIEQFPNNHYHYGIKISDLNQVNNDQPWFDDEEALAIRSICQNHEIQILRRDL